MTAKPTIVARVAPIRSTAAAPVTAATGQERLLDGIEPADRVSHETTSCGVKKREGKMP